VPQYILETSIDPKGQQGHLVQVDEVTRIFGAEAIDEGLPSDQHELRFAHSPNIGLLALTSQEKKGLPSF
jgi:hypothetical protein